MAIGDTPDDSTPSEAADRVREAGTTIEGGEMPLPFYNDQDIFDLELERIFGESWIFVGHESEIPDEGDYARRHIANDTFIFVRDEDGGIKLFLDSCRHRGTQLCRADKGNTSHFRCPYHGWTYDNSGELVGVPYKHMGFEEMDKDDYALLEAPRVDTYAGLVFASLAEEGQSLDEYLGGLKWYLDIVFKLPDGGMEVIGEPHRWVIESNWKVISDNLVGQDSYHHESTHRSASEALGGAETINEPGAAEERGGEQPHKHVRVSNGQIGVRGGLIEDRDVFFNYPEEVREFLTQEGLSETQYNLARGSMGNAGSVFPNFIWIYLGDAVDSPNKDAGPYLTLRKFRPISPNQTEMVSWGLAPKQAPESVKERMYELYVANFGPSGNFEQDDATIWEGITAMSDSQLVKKQDLNGRYVMGMEGMSHTPVDYEWPGPGAAADTDYEAGGLRYFHETWYHSMLNGIPPASED